MEMLATEKHFEFVLGGNANSLNFLCQSMTNVAVAFYLNCWTYVCIMGYIIPLQQFATTTIKLILLKFFKLILRNDFYFRKTFSLSPWMQFLKQIGELISVQFFEKRTYKVSFKHTYSHICKYIYESIWVK